MNKLSYDKMKNVNTIQNISYMCQYTAVIIEQMFAYIGKV